MSQARPLPSILIALSLLLASPSFAQGGDGKLARAQAEFRRGDYPRALRTLDAATAESRDDASLARLHLLRAQVFNAQRDLFGAEEALARALEHDPEARLDPARVDPSLVSMLEGLKKRLQGELRVTSNRPGTTVSLDGKPLGTAPLKARVPIGRQTISGVSDDGGYLGETEIVVRPKRLAVAELELQARPLVSQGAKGMEIAGVGRVRPLGEVRLGIDALQVLSEGVGIEVGGGLESEHLRATLTARLFPRFGLTLRGSFFVPVAEQLRAYVSLEVPAYFLGTVAIGLGGSAGVEYVPSPWIAPFVELGARQFFLAPSGYPTSRLTAHAGARLRLP